MDKKKPTRKSRKDAAQVALSVVEKATGAKLARSEVRPKQAPEPH
jgi:hypothetical protein